MGAAELVVTGKYGSRYSRMDQVNLWETALKKFGVIWSA